MGMVWGVRQRWRKGLDPNLCCCGEGIMVLVLVLISWLAFSVDQLLIGWIVAAIAAVTLIVNAYKVGFNDGKAK